MIYIKRTFNTEEELLHYIKVMLTEQKIFTLNIENLTLFISYNND